MEFKEFYEIQKECTETTIGLKKGTFLENTEDVQRALT